MIKDISPDEIKGCEVVSVQRIGGYWSWRKFRYMKATYYIFTKNGIYNWVEG